LIKILGIKGLDITLKTNWGTGYWADYKVCIMADTTSWQNTHRTFLADKKKSAL
jgi:hypothetical protein